MTSGKESQKKLRERFLFERTESDKATKRERERLMGWEETRESDYESLRREEKKKKKAKRRKMKLESLL